MTREKVVQKKAHIIIHALGLVFTVLITENNLPAQQVVSKPLLHYELHKASMKTLKYVHSLLNLETTWACYCKHKISKHNLCLIKRNCVLHNVLNHGTISPTITISL